MNPDRLSDLRRQRALVAEHLAWLDREIAAETGGPEKNPSPSPLPFRPPSPPPPETPPEAVFAAYQADPLAVHRDAKRGCLVYVAAAVLVFVLALAAIYFAFYRDRPLVYVSSPPDSSPATSPADKTSATPPKPPSSPDRRSDPSRR